MAAGARRVSAGSRAKDGTGSRLKGRLTHELQDGRLGEMDCNNVPLSCGLGSDGPAAGGHYDGGWADSSCDSGSIGVRNERPGSGPQFFAASGNLAASNASVSPAKGLTVFPADRRLARRTTRPPPPPRTTAFFVVVIPAFAALETRCFFGSGLPAGHLWRRWVGHRALVRPHRLQFLSGSEWRDPVCARLLRRTGTLGLFESARGWGALTSRAAAAAGEGGGYSGIRWGETKFWMNSPHRPAQCVRQRGRQGVWFIGTDLSGFRQGRRFENGPGSCASGLPCPTGVGGLTELRRCTLRVAGDFPENRTSGFCR